jgi:hypothetical protein
MTQLLPSWIFLAARVFQRIRAAAVLMMRLTG